MGVVGPIGSHQCLTERLNAAEKFSAVLRRVWLTSVSGLVQRQARRMRQCAQALEGGGADGVQV